MGEAKRKRGARQKQGARRVLDVNTGELSEPRPAEITPSALLYEDVDGAIGAAGVPAAGRGAVPALPRVFTTTVLRSGSGRTAPVSI